MGGLRPVMVQPQEATRSGCSYQHLFLEDVSEGADAGKDGLPGKSKGR